MDLSREVGPWLQKPKAVFPKDLPTRLKKRPGVMAAYFSVKTKFSCRKPLKMIVHVGALLSVWISYQCLLLIYMQKVEEGK